MTAVILAAGQSRRMGHPKALLEWRGETYLDRLIRILGAHCGDIVVVLRRDGEAELGACARLAEARLAINEEPERGQMSSLLAGLEKVGAGGDVIFTPVDYGHVGEQTVAAIVSAARGSEADVVNPRFEDRNGHPVVIRDAVRQALEQAGVEGEAREVIRRFSRLGVEVADPGVVMDADDPEAYERIKEQAV